MHRTVLSHAFAEKKTARFTGILKDESGSNLTPGDVNAVTLTLYLKDKETIINQRDGVSILNENGGTLDGSGNLALQLGPDDMIVLKPAQKFEVHVALIEWTYNGGDDAGAHEIEFTVENLRKVA